MVTVATVLVLATSGALLRVALENSGTASWACLVLSAVIFGTMSPFL